MQLSSARCQPLAQRQVSDCKAPWPVPARHPVAATLPAYRRRKAKLSCNGRGARSRNIVVYATSVDADSIGTWALMGMLLSFAGFGTVTALKTGAEDRREKMLLARAKARHEAYIQSGVLDGMGEEEERIETDTQSQQEGSVSIHSRCESEELMECGDAGLAMDGMSEEKRAEMDTQPQPGEMAPSHLHSQSEDAVEAGNACPTVDGMSKEERAEIGAHLQQDELAPSHLHSQSEDAVDIEDVGQATTWAPDQEVSAGISNAEGTAAGSDSVPEKASHPPATQHLHGSSSGSGAEILSMAFEVTQPSAPPPDEHTNEEQQPQHGTETARTEEGLPSTEQDNPTSEAVTVPPAPQLLSSSQTVPMQTGHEQVGSPPGTDQMQNSTRAAHGSSCGTSLDTGTELVTRPPESGEGPLEARVESAAQHAISPAGEIANSPISRAPEEVCENLSKTDIQPNDIAHSEVDSTTGASAEQEQQAMSDKRDSNTDLLPFSAKAHAEDQVPHVQAAVDLSENQAVATANQPCTSSDITSPAATASSTGSPSTSFTVKQTVPAVLEFSTKYTSTQNNKAVQLFYYTAWDSPIAHGSLAGSGWADYTAEKASPGQWHTFSWDATASQEANPLLEFVMTDKSRSRWDKPIDGGNYLIQEPGTYMLRNGVLSKCGEGPLFMVVSDLDGTMVGNDSFTSEFKEFWDSGPRPRGCKLVYSTGRSLDLFMELAEEKKGILAQPDYLILGVGTEIRSFQGSNTFKKDESWGSVLDKGWNIEKVRDTLYAAIAEFGKDSMHFRPSSEQNDHKVTCGVKTEILQQVIASIKLKLDGHQVDANIIPSGQGDWRYLDIVSRQAGKRESLEFVAKAEGFSLEQTVACGDSGNDILMLAGDSKAIVVGNAQDDLRKWVDENPEAVKPTESGTARLYVAGAQEAQGILEGLSYFQFKPQ